MMSPTVSQYRPSRSRRANPSMMIVWLSPQEECNSPCEKTQCYWTSRSDEGHFSVVLKGRGLTKGENKIFRDVRSSCVEVLKNCTRN